MEEASRAEGLPDPRFFAKAEVAKDQRIYSIPVENLAHLIEAIKADILKNSQQWDGKSYIIAKYFKDNKIDPVIDERYRHFYSTERHTVSASYVWQATRMEEFVEETRKPSFAGERIWIDVLINKQFEVDSSSVIRLTEEVYNNCKVLVMLSKGIFKRGWCLFEAANYVAHSCQLLVVGTCDEVQGVDFIHQMQTTYEEDRDLIIKEIQRKFGSDYRTKFNRDVEEAIMEVYAESLLYNGRFQEAEGALKKCLQLRLERGDSELLQADTLNQMGRAYHSLGNYEAALKVYGDELNIRIKCLGNNHVSVSTTKSNIGTVYAQQGKYEKALEYYEEALAVEVKCLGNNHVSVASTQDNMGIVYMQQGQYEKALEYHGKALETRISQLGNNHVSVASTYCNMGRVYDSLGQYEKALEMYEKDLEITVKCLGNDHVSVATTKKNMARVYHEQGNHGEALRLCEEALEIEVNCLGNDHVSVAMTKENIAIVHVASGNKRAAKELYQGAYDIFYKTLGPDHFNTKKALKGLKAL